MEKLQTARGSRDILPEEQKIWQWIRQTLQDKAWAFGFERIDLPSFEDERVFVRAVGSGTDIVEKELFRVSRYTNESRDKEKKTNLVLRPEGTAGVARAYVEKGMSSLPSPVKLWYIGSMFRYDRPQKGRYREFQSMGAELIGDDSAGADAQTVLFAWQVFESLELENELIVDINSIGDKNCRPKIKKSIKDYFVKYKKDLCTDCQRRLAVNPIRLLDCKQKTCQKIRENAPQCIDLLCETCKKHFLTVLEYLDELNIPYNINPSLVRGLDYYTKTTFEIKLKDDVRSQNTLAGGGRYDNLIEQMGGKSTPAIGFAVGIDRIVDLLRDKNSSPPLEKKLKITLIQIGEKAKLISLSVLKELTRLNYRVFSSPGKDTLKAQLRLADKLDADTALIIGQKEAFDSTIIVKNLKNGAQETVLRKNLVSYLVKKLG